MEFAKRLTREIRRSGKTQVDVALEIGVRPPTLNKWCRGFRTPSLPVYEKLQARFPNIDSHEPDSEAVNAAS